MTKVTQKYNMCAVFRCIQHEPRPINCGIDKICPQFNKKCSQSLKCEDTKSEPMLQFAYKENYKNFSKMIIILLIE